MENGTVQMDLTDLLDRIYLPEKYVQHYPKGQQTKEAEALYQQYLYAAITGEQTPDTEKDGENRLYLEKASGKIEGKAIETYNTFITGHSKSITAQILAEYLDVLDESNRRPEGETVIFYQGLEKRIEEKLDRIG